MQDSNSELGDDELCEYMSDYEVLASETSDAPASTAVVAAEMDQG